MRRPAPVVALLCAALLAASCSGGDDDESRPGDDGGEAGSWTFLHYSMADTDLEEFMVADVNEMGSVGSHDELAIRAFVDRSPEYSDADVLDVGDWIGAKVLDIGEGTAEVVEDLGDVDAADPATLASFLAEGIEAHPADHYALVISDHGASWPGIGPDETADGNVLDLAELTRGVADGLEQAGVEKLDLLGFDACLMASYEVASAVAPLADRLVASQELEPGHGWDYASLEVLAGGADVDAFGEALLDGFVGQATDEGNEASITLSLIDLTQMAAVDEAVGAFAGALAERVDTVAPVVGRAESRTLGFARSPDETQDAHLTDLGLLAAAIGVDALDVSDEADQVVRSLNDAVLASVDGEATQGASGLSIYFPPTPDLAADAYGEVGSAAPWRAFLGAYYAAGEAIPLEEEPDFVGDEAEVAFDEDGVTVSGVFEELGADNLVDATIGYALVNDDGSLTYFGEEFAEIAEDGSPSATGFFDLTALKISDGEDTAYAYLALYRGDTDDVFTIDVPMAYYPPGEDEAYEEILLTLTVDVDSGDVVDEVYYVFDEESGTYGELDADPEGIIVPQLLVIGPDGEETWEPTTDVGLFANLEDLQYELESLASGTRLQLDLTVGDYGGNSDTISTRVTLP